MIPVYFDVTGLPVTKDGDGGDSCATAGNLLVTEEFPRMMPVGMYLYGTEPVRHPDRNKWYGRPGRFSRDQLVAMLCGLAMSHNPWARKELFKMHFKRGFVLAWNRIRNHVYEDPAEHLAKSTPDVLWNPRPKMPDICGPEVWALWIRVWRAWPLYPLLLVLDLESFLGALHWRYFRRDNVARNHLLSVYIGVQVMPTPISILSYYATDFVELKRRWKNHCAATGELYSMKGIL